MKQKRSCVRMPKAEDPSPEWDYVWRRDVWSSHTPSKHWDNKCLEWIFEQGGLGSVDGVSCGAETILCPSGVMFLVGTEKVFYCLNKWTHICLCLNASYLPVCQGHRLAYVYWAVDGCSETTLLRTWVYVLCVTVMPLPVKLNLWDYPKFINDSIFICSASSRPLVLFSVIGEESL